MERLKVTPQQIIAINDATIGQRDNPVWLMLRKGRLTSSNFGCVLQVKRVTPSLMKRVLGDYNLSGVHAINWGINNESVAVKAFQQAIGLVVKESGLWRDPSGTLGATPDGLIGSNALLEVKFPFTQRQNTISEAVMSKDFCLEKSGDDKFTLKKSHIIILSSNSRAVVFDRGLSGARLIHRALLCSLIVGLFAFEDHHCSVFRLLLEVLFSCFFLLREKVLRHSS